MTHEDGLVDKTLCNWNRQLYCNKMSQHPPKGVLKKRSDMLPDRSADSPRDARARWQELLWLAVMMAAVMCARCHDASARVWADRTPHHSLASTALYTEYSHSNNMYTLQTSWDFDIDTVKNTHTQYSIFRALSEDPTGNFTINLCFKNSSRIYYYVFLAYNENMYCAEWCSIDVRNASSLYGGGHDHKPGAGAGDWSTTTWAVVSSVYTAHVCSNILIRWCWQQLEKMNIPYG